MEITKILKKYDTDKESFHRYGSSYETIFSQYDRDDKLNILEIGTQKGGSLLAWKEYFPNANVVGVDIIDVVPEKYKKDTVTRIVCDIKEWRDDTVWDIVIDDGSHYLLDLAYTITNFCPKLAANGVLIIEDVRDPGLLLKVIKNLLADISIYYPRLKHNHYFDVRTYDTSSPKSPGSFIIAMFKYMV